MKEMLFLFALTLMGIMAKAQSADTITKPIGYRIVLRCSPRTISAADKAVIILLDHSTIFASNASERIISGLNKDWIQNINVINGADGIRLYGNVGKYGALCVTLKDSLQASNKWLSRLISNKQIKKI